MHIALFLACQSAFWTGCMALPERYWPFLLITKSAMTILSGGAQISLNFQNKSTGQLAWSPVALRIFGNSARIVTTLVNARGDLMLLFLYITSFTVQSLLGLQFIAYR